MRKLKARWRVKFLATFHNHYRIYRYYGIKIQMLNSNSSVYCSHSNAFSTVWWSIDLRWCHWIYRWSTRNFRPYSFRVCSVNCCSTILSPWVSAKWDCCPQCCVCSYLAHRRCASPWPVPMAMYLRVLNVINISWWLVMEMSAWICIP